MPEWLGKTVGRVRIEKLLARGGTAEVYLGTHLTLERPVAVKVLHRYIEEQPALLEGFYRTGKAVAGLRHPNIVQIFDVGSIEGHPYIVMQYLKGPTLAEYLRRLHKQRDRIPSDKVARLIKGLADALDYLHSRGVIHTTISPGNILLHSKANIVSLDRGLSNDVEPILIGLALAQISHATSTGESETITGIPAYMSPEQARGDKIDHRSDIYSLGVVLYEMLAGGVPFKDEDTLSVLIKHIHSPPPPIEEVSLAVQVVVNRALEKDPDHRYQTSHDLAVDYFQATGMHARSAAIPETVSVAPLRPVTAAESQSIEPVAKGQKGGHKVNEKQARAYSNKPDNRGRSGKKSTGKLETSIACPTLLSKRFASPFVLQYYFPQQRQQALNNIRAELGNPKVNEHRQTSSVKFKQKVRVKFFAHAFDFSEPITRVVDQDVNIFRFLGRPKDDCEPGFHKILISISDDASGQELESMTITAQVVDFAFDHVSRPWLSRISAIVLGFGSFTMFLLGLLEQIDRTVGLTSGTAAGILAVFVYGNFYTLYQRVRATSS